MMDWQIYYSDGSVISSDEATPYNLIQRVDVQVIIQEHPDKGWIGLSGYDYFMWDDRGGGFKWFRGDLFGLYHYLTTPGKKAVLLGTWVDDEVYNGIMEQVQKDRIFLNKTGKAKREREP